MNDRKPIDEQFRDIVRRVPVPTAIVAAGTGEAGGVAMTATALSVISTAEPTVLICLSDQGVLAPILDEGVAISINLLTMQDAELAIAFSGEGRATASDGRWALSKADTPVLAGGLANLTGTITDLGRMGGQLIVLAAIDGLTERARAGGDKAQALMHVDGYFGLVKTLRATTGSASFDAKTARSRAVDRRPERALSVFSALSRRPRS
ncbi:MAG: flavin reductase [Pseudomonadota bacterium]